MKVRFLPQPHVSGIVMRMESTRPEHSAVHTCKKLAALVFKYHYRGRNALEDPRFSLSAVTLSAIADGKFEECLHNPGRCLGSPVYGAPFARMHALPSGSGPQV